MSGFLKSRIERDMGKYLGGIVEKPFDIWDIRNVIEYFFEGG